MARTNPLANLASLSMRQLRELARTLGIQRYSAQDRDSLAESIADRSAGRAEMAAAVTPEVAPRPVAA
ncbi:DUF4912 domain-containing protein, partial [Cyanobium gracile UHCC 0139]|nr:DUF4912 domain-containing protein [Cyanobium gracile UHCC 0139]